MKFNTKDIVKVYKGVKEIMGIAPRGFIGIVYDRDPNDKSYFIGMYNSKEEDRFWVKEKDLEKIEFKRPKGFKKFIKDLFKL